MQFLKENLTFTGEDLPLANLLPSLTGAFAQFERELMRAYLRDIFSEALDQDFLVKDPALRVKVPGQLKQTGKTTLTWDQLRRSSSSSIWRTLYYRVSSSRCVGDALTRSTQP